MRRPTEALLTALAYARGTGTNDDLWLRLTRSLGYTDVSQYDIDQLRRSNGADYLLQTVTEHDGTTVRLFHQALIDELLEHRTRQQDETKIFTALLDHVHDNGGWQTADTYALRHATDHAAASGRLQILVEDPLFLTTTDPQRLLSTLVDNGHSTSPAATLLRRFASRATKLPAAERAQLLTHGAAQLGLTTLQHQLASVCPPDLIPAWAHTTTDTPHQELTGHTGPVTTLAIGRAGDRDIIATTSDDQTVRIWDATTGTPIGDPLTGHTDPVTTLAIGRAGDRDIIATASSDRTVRIWDAATGDPIGDPLTGHTDPVTALAIGRAGDRDIIATTSSDRTVRIWDATTGTPIGDPLTGHTDPVYALAIDHAADRDIIATAGWDDTVRIWALDGTNASRTIHLNGTAVAVVCSLDRLFIATRTGLLCFAPIPAP